MHTNANCKKTKEFWIDSAANDRFVWDLTLFRTCAALSGSQTEIGEGSSETISQRKIEVPQDCKKIKVTAKRAP